VVDGFRGFCTNGEFVALVCDIYEPQADFKNK
jgi:hypothetical protein